MKQHKLLSRLAAVAPGFSLVLVTLFCLSSPAHADSAHDERRKEAAMPTDKPASDKNSRLLNDLAQGNLADSNQRRIDELNRHIQTLTTLGGSIILLAVSAYFLRRLRRSNRQLEQSQKQVRALTIGLEQKVQEQTVELRNRELVFRTLVENSPDVIFRYDRDCRRVYVNPAVARISGKSADMLLGKTPTEAALVPSAESVKVQQAILRMLETGEQDTIDVLFVAPDGSQLYFQNTHVPEFGPDGTVVGVLAVGRDITSRKRMETILLESEREYRTLAENAPGCIIRFDRDCRTRYINQKFEALLGMPIAFMLDKPIAEVFSDGLFDELELVMQGVIEKRRVIDYDLILPDTGKGEHYYRFTLTPEQNSQGELTGVLVVGHDITESKRYEQELLARAKLEQRLSTLTESLPGFVFTIRVDADGHTSFPYVSSTVEKLFGLRPEDVREDAAVLRARYHPDDLPRVLALMKETERTLAQFLIEIRITNRDNQQSWIEIRSMPQRQPDGSTEWHGVMLDITERKCVESELFSQMGIKQTLLNAINEVGMQMMMIENGRIIHVGNRELAHQFGYTDEELEAHPPLLDLIHPDDREKVMNYYASRIKGEAVPNSYELVLISKDGHRYEFETSIAVIPNTDPVRVITIGKDISERKRMEQNLAQREREYRVLAEYCPDSIYRYDRDYRRLYVNPTVCRIVGKSAQELIGGTIDDGRILVSKQGKLVMDHIDRVFESGEPAYFMVEFIEQDGVHSDYQMTIVPEHDVDGRVVTVLGFTHNVTEIRRLERQQSQYFATVPGAFATVLKRADGSFAMPFISEGVRELYGLEPEAVMRDIMVFAALAHPDDAEMTFRKADESARDLIPYRVEYRINHPGKGIRWIECISTPQRMPDGGTRWDGFYHDITERRQTQRQSELLGHAVNQSSDAIFLIDEQLRFAYVNERACRSLGYSAEELLTMTPVDIDPNITCEILVEMMKHTFALEGAPSRIESCHRTIDGRIFPVEIVASTVKFGDVKYALTMARDITERKDAQAQMARFMNNMPGFAYSFRIAPDGHASFPFVSRGIADIYGLTPEEVRDDMAPLHLLSHPEDRPLTEAAIAESARTMSPFRVEVRVLRPGHPVRWIECRAIPEREADGSILWQGIMLDIHERKRMERLLIASEREFRSLADNLPDNIARWDVEGRILHSNSIHQRSLGKSARDLIGKTHRESFPDGRYDPVDAGIAQVIATGQPSLFVRQPVPFENGVIEIHDVTLVPERDAAGNIVSVLGIGRNMTELYRLQDNLSEAQKLARLGSWDWDILMNRVEWSETAGEIYTPDTRPARPAFEDFKSSVHPDDLERVLAAIQSTFDHETTYDLSHRVVSVSKGTRTVHAQGKLFRDANGKPIRMLGTVQDITERKRTEDALKFIAQGDWLNNDEEYLTALASYLGRELGLDYVIIDKLADDPAYAETVALYAKGAVVPNMQYSLQYTPCENVMKGGLCCYPESIQQQFPKDTLLVDMQAESYAGIPLWDSKGKVIGLIALMDGKPMRDTNALTAMLQLVATSAAAALERQQVDAMLKERFEQIVELNHQLEINARDLEDQAAEFEAQAVELEASQEQIMQTEAWYRSILHSAPDGMLVVDSGGRIIQANVQLETMFGYASGELPGCRLEVLIPQAARAAHVDKRKAFVSGEQRERRMAGAAKDLFGCRKDGSVFPVDVSLSRLPDLDGRVGAICAAVRDVSERQKTDAARENALSEALRLAQLRSAFLAQMSHELRTPLNGILGYAQNLLHGETLAEKQVDGLRIIQHSGEHLLSLINGILDHAAIEADKFELIPGDIELEPFLATIIGIIRVRAEQKNIAFTCAADAGLPAVVRGDAQRLRQVLLNLLSNAVKFTDKGKVNFRVNFIAPSRLHFAVQDSGVGIGADQLESIFLPFEQVGEISHRAGGTGLGLAISRKLVMLMGSDIKVESQPDTGSTFSFEIEMEAVEAGAAKVNVAALSEQALARVTQTNLLLAPPRPELDILHGLALRGNMRDVIKHADHLAELDQRYLPFVEQLRQLAKHFQTKALVSLIEQYRNGEDVV